MDNDKIWLSPPHMGGGEGRYIEAAFKTNWVAPAGQNISGFEADLQDYLGHGVYAAALSSGTAAVHLGLELLGVKPGDFVICQSLTFVASANPITYLGAQPVFVDSEPDTWNLNPQAVEDAVKNCIKMGMKPAAINAVSLYGMPYKADEISEISERYGIPVLEDSAEALGSRYRGKPCGTLGDVSVLSFNGNKIITTSGGGALVSRDKNLRDRAVYLATQAKDQTPHYEHSATGYNYRMSNICAGIGRGQMEVLEERVRQRRENHLFYADIFKDEPAISLFKEFSEDFFSNHWLSVLTVNSNDKQITPELLRMMLGEFDIETRPLWKPMHMQPLFRKAPYFGGNIAQNLFATGLCLPSGSSLTDRDKDRIAAAFKNILARGRG